MDAVSNVSKIVKAKSIFYVKKLEKTNKEESKKKVRSIYMEKKHSLKDEKSDPVQELGQFRPGAQFINAFDLKEMTDQTEKRKANAAKDLERTLVSLLVQKYIGQEIEKNLHHIKSDIRSAATGVLEPIVDEQEATKWDDKARHVMEWYLELSKWSYELWSRKNVLAHLQETLRGKRGQKLVLKTKLDELKLEKDELIRAKIDKTEKLTKIRDKLSNMRSALNAKKRLSSNEMPVSMEHTSTWSYSIGQPEKLPSQIEVLRRHIDKKRMHFQRWQDRNAELKKSIASATSEVAVKERKKNEILQEILQIKGDLADLEKVQQHRLKIKSQRIDMMPTRFNNRQCRSQNSADPPARRSTLRRGRPRISQASSARGRVRFVHPPIGTKRSWLSTTEEDTSETSSHEL